MNTETMTVDMMPVDTLIPYARNAKLHNDTQIAAIAGSIKEFGFNNPVLIDSDGGIIAGHGRVMAARKLGLLEVPCIQLDHLTDNQKRAYILADNRLAEIGGGWDAELLKLELDDLRLEDVDIDGLGFDDASLDELLADVGGDEGTEGLTDPDEVPEVPAVPVTKPGDVWLLGKHRLMCGDSTSIDAVKNLVPGGGVGILLTDPPYNVAYEGKTKDALTIQNDSMSDASFRKFLCDAFTAANSVMAPGAVFYIWHADSEGYNFRGACFDVGWEVRQCLIWKKSLLILGRQDYHWIHEPCLYGWKDGAGHFWASDRKQTTVMEFDKPTRNGEHPTMKPVDLFEYQMLNNTKKGDVVLDIFGGSGTTLIAAERNSRVARIMELDPKYCDVIIKRWQDFTGKQATLEATGEPFPSQ